MTLQTGIALLAVASAAIYLAKGLVESLRSTKNCASGCGGCGVKVCPAKRLERIRDRA